MNKLPRKKKKKFKKNVIKAVKLLAKIAHEAIVLKHQIEEVAFYLKAFSNSIPFYVEEPITRCDRLIELKQ